MITLIFFLTVIALVSLLISILVKLIRHKSMQRVIIITVVLVVVYGLVWIIFYLTMKIVPVPMGTEVCFDDWCATAIKAERQADMDSTLIILHVRMSNHAGRIAQKPSEPRVYILDSSGQRWPYSFIGQQNYEKQNGHQPGIGHLLELHESMESVLIFAVPKNSIGLKALIEEGPWITKLLFPEDEQVFLIGQ